MKMVKTYKGYFHEGRFISSEAARIPDHVEVFVMITGNELSPPKTKSQQQLEAFDKFVSAVRSIDDEPLTDDDLSALENNRSNFYRDVTL